MGSPPLTRRSFRGAPSSGLCSGTCTKPHAHLPRYGRDLDDYGDPDFEDSCRRFESPADDAQLLAAREKKEELKVHPEGLVKWFRSIEHYGCLVGLSGERITRAWKFFSSEVCILAWLRVMLRREYGVTRLTTSDAPSAGAS